MKIFNLSTIHTQQFSIFNSKKGVSLYLALMIMFILIAIGLGVSLIIVSQMKMIRGMGNSVVALYAADTGIEHAMYNRRKDGGTGAVNGTLNISGEPASYNVNSFLPVEKKWRSVGSYKGTRRAIEINEPPTSPPAGSTNQYTQPCSGDCGTAPCLSGGGGCYPDDPYYTCSKSAGACSGAPSPCPPPPDPNSSLFSNTCSCKAEGFLCASECAFIGGAYVCPDSTFCGLNPRGICTYQCNDSLIWNGTECVTP